MKIIEEGRDLSPKGPPWYTRRPIRCPHCGCTFELSEYDRVDAKYPDWGSTPFSVSVDCPNKTCGYHMSLNNSRQDEIIAR